MICTYENLCTSTIEYLLRYVQCTFTYIFLTWSFYVNCFRVGWKKFEFSIVCLCHQKYDLTRKRRGSGGERRIENEKEGGRGNSWGNNSLEMNYLGEFYLQGYGLFLEILIIIWKVYGFIYRVFIKYCVFYLTFCHFSQLC